VLGNFASIAEATGHSAIFEYIDGEQVTHHGRAYQVMTNSPIFSGQRDACIALPLGQKRRRHAPQKPAEPPKEIFKDNQL
jgi:hypothetical protein